MAFAKFGSIASGMKKPLRYAVMTVTVTSSSVHPCSPAGIRLTISTISDMRPDMVKPNNKALIDKCTLICPLKTETMTSAAYTVTYMM